MSSVANKIIELRARKAAKPETRLEKYQRIAAAAQAALAVVRK